ncbi:hypothetical protein JCM10213_004729 [Rhodosporidiobolus nylandii]
MADSDRPPTPPGLHTSRPASPSLVLHGQKQHGEHVSRSNTPNGGRPKTPSRVQKNPADDYMKPKYAPNNRGLADPREQDRASDLLGHEDTEPVRDPPSEAELAKVRELAAALEKKKK